MSWFRRKPATASPVPADGAGRGNNGNGSPRKNANAESATAHPRELPRGIDADFCYSEERKG